MPIVEDYLELTVKWKREYGDKTIVLMQVGSFFEVYALKNDSNELFGSDIIEFAQINDMIIAEKTKVIVNNCKVMMAGFGLAQLDKYIKKLQSNGYTIAIYTQDIQGKNTTRSLSEIISPGTYFSLETTEISNNIMCIWLHKSNANKIVSSQITIGISNIDIYTGKTSIYQFSNNYYHNPCTYDDLEKQVAVYNPNECLIVSNLEEYEINDIIEYTNINSKKIHKIQILEQTTNLSKFAKNSEKQLYQKAVINKFYPNLSEDKLISVIPTHCIAIQSFTLLLDFTYQHSPHLVDKLAMPCFENYTDRMLLANHSLSQLNILDDQRYTGKCRSVGALLNNCKTSMGKRLFMYNLHNPTTNKNKLTKSYNITEHLLENKEWIKYRELLNGMRDLEKFERKIVIKKVSPKDIALFVCDLDNLLKIYSLTNTDAVMTEYLHELLTESAIELNVQINEILTNLHKTFNISKCINIDDVSVDKLGNLSTDLLYFINDNISEPIDKNYSKCLDSRNILEAIAKRLSEIIGSKEKSTSSKQLFVKIHETPKSDPVLLSTKRRITILKSILSNVKETEIDINYVNHQGKMQVFKLSINNLEYKSMGNNKTELCISNDLIDKITKNIQNVEEELKNDIVLFYNNYILNFINYQKSLKQITDYVKIIDTLQCKAYIADKYNYCKPEIIASDKSFVAFEGIRHPLIEHIQTQELYVTNDLTIGQKTDGVLLYGTNAVGKTSLIKSIGISIIMAQAGLYVPCKEFKYFPYSCIFTRILGNDNIFKGLSTFAVEMSELRTILNLADKNSLILGDELCSGTESDSALSIFASGLESLHARQSSFIFATHYQQILEYDEIKILERMKIYHMSVIYDNETKKLIYNRKLQEGLGLMLYGLEVAKSLNLPDDIIRRAYEIRNKYKNINNILDTKNSTYNSKKLKDKICEICKKIASSDIHHLQFQQNANNKKIINDSFQMNHAANLISICKECHNNIHKNNTEYKRVKTTTGYELQEIK